MELIAKLGAAARKLHWVRGLRAGLAVFGAMLVCQIFHDSIGWAGGWAALGGFEAILVDNGGPYRSRFATIATLMTVGTVACVAATFAVGRGPAWAALVPMLVTAGFCFAVTFARVIAQPIASTSVIILVIYFVAFGSSQHSLRQASWNALAFVLGGAWAAVLSLVLWPVDPFRPARLAVAECYLTLSELPSTIAPTERGSEARELARHTAFDWQRRMRTRMESARAALTATTARVASRTHRARNLIVLLETADMLLAVTMRTTELALALEVEAETAKVATAEPNEDSLRRFVLWLSEAERAIAYALERRPKGASAARGLDIATCSEVGPRQAQRTRQQVDPETNRQQEAILAHLAAAELEAAQNIEIACVALNAVWSGVESPNGTPRLTEAMTSVLQAEGRSRTRVWAETVRANWTLDSVMMRHALRMMVVSAVDVLLLRWLHLSHGYWLGMTSIIVLQPYQSNTLKRGFERVGGTIAGGIFAALLAAAIPSQSGILLAVTVTSVLTLATYAVDYAWYCFFLTPTFVLMGLPHLGDWRYSGVRILTTFLGALVAVAAMRLLWPEREHLTLTRSLGRSAAADAAYLRSLLAYWQRVSRTAERELLAPARRRCGLASNEAEESLDRLKLESGFGRFAPPASATHLIEEHALTFVTYIRRLTQSITTLAVVGRPDPDAAKRLQALAEHMEEISAALSGGRPLTPRFRQPEASGGDDNDIAVHQLQRMGRQVAVLERATAGVLGAAHGASFGEGEEQKLSSAVAR